MSEENILKIKANTNAKESEFNISNVYKYLFFWKFFVAAFLAGLTISFLVNRYSTKIYNTTAKIQVLENDATAIESIEDLMFGNQSDNLDNHIEIIKSFPILERVSENLNLTSTLIRTDKIKSKIDNSPPFTYIQKIPPSKIEENKYKITLKDGNIKIKNTNTKESIFFDNIKKISSNEIPFTIKSLDKEIWKAQGTSSITVVFNDLKHTTKHLQKKIKVNTISKNSDVITLSLNSSSREYSEKILNEIIRVYQEDLITDRKRVYESTIKFIDSRFNLLSEELDSIEIHKFNFKKDNDLVDIEVNASISFEKNLKSEQMVFSVNNEITITELLIKNINVDSITLLPSNVGINNIEINNLVLDYNDKVLTFEKLVTTAGYNNPFVIQLNRDLNLAKVNISRSLKNHYNQLISLKNKYEKRLNDIDKNISNLPEKEKILRAIERYQNTKESLYLYLLQKQEEAQVAAAITESNIKIIEPAISSQEPISPKPILIYVLFPLSAIVLVFIFLFFYFSLDNKIHTREQLKKEIDEPIIGEIPYIEDSVIIDSSKDRSVVAESFRVAISNIKFMISDLEDKCKTMLVTSTLKGEGKSFTAINLALTFSTIKKVLLIGADVRNPQLHKYLELEKSSEGLVNYLSDEKSNWEDKINHHEHFENCDILLSGAIPPNPTQLLNSNKMKELIRKARLKYDYIIIDTPPCMLVSDTFTLSPLSDLVVYVARANLTRKDSMKFVKESTIIKVKKCRTSIKCCWRNF